jgi:hypothetical protein
VVRVTARVWWELKWVAMLGVAVFGPEWRAGLKTLADARVTEFAKARRLAEKLA